MDKKELEARYPEAFAYLAARSVKPPEAFYTQLEALRGQTFTLSKLTQIEQIAQVKQSLVEALEAGQSFANWKKNLTAEQLALPKHYLQTVYRNATQQAYNAGKWTHFRDNPNRPILRYIAIDDSRTRPAHKAMHGFMAHVDDPIWQTHAPSNGHNCRCTLVSLTEKQARDRGYTGDSSLPSYADKHGNLHIAQPDKGWSHSPENNDLTALLREREKKHGYPSVQIPEKNSESIKDIFFSTETIRAEGESLRLQYEDIIDQSLMEGKPHEGILEILRREGVKTGAVARVVSVKEEADTIEEFIDAIKRYPADWVEKSNRAGLIGVRSKLGRAYARQVSSTAGDIEYFKTARGFEYLPFKEAAKKGEIKVGDILTFILKNTKIYKADMSTKWRATHIHEFGHRLQVVMPELDALFSRLWQERTVGEPIESLRKLTGLNYDSREVTKKDHFPNPYWGKIYNAHRPNPKPLEMLTMAFESLIGGDTEKFNLLYKDKPLFDTVLAIFTRYRA